MAEWNGCICLSCGVKYPEAAGERQRVLRALYQDPCSRINREKENDG